MNSNNYYYFGIFVGLFFFKQSLTMQLRLVPNSQ